MHFQRAPHAEVKLVRCIKGAIYDVIVDMREGSPDYLRWFGAELSDDNGLAMYVPQGFAHGYQALSDGAGVFYMVSAFYAPQSEGGLRHDDPALAIAWPRPVTEVSDKDARWPLLPRSCSPADRLCRPSGDAGAQRARLPRARRGAGRASKTWLATDGKSRRPDLWSETPRGGPRLPRHRHRHPRRLVRGAGISAVAGEYRLPERHAAPRAGARKPRCAASSASAPASNTTSRRLSARRYAAEAYDALCAAKAAAFTALSQLLPQQRVEFRWCRLFYLYGEGEDARRLVPYLRPAAAGEPAELTSGTQIRDFLDVREAGRMIAESALGSVQGP